MGSLYAGSPVATVVDKVTAGTVSLVLARAGVGKTAFLAHAALAELLQDHQVLHVAITDTVDHARAHHDEVLRTVIDQLDGPDPAVRVERNRQVLSFHGKVFSTEALARFLDVMADAATFSPTLWVVDGLLADNALVPTLERLGELARERGAACWVSVQSETPLATEVFSCCQLVVRLVPDGTLIRLHGVHGAGPGISMALDPGTLLARAPSDATDTEETRVTARDCTLYSGGALGSEATFGEAAERWGVHEVNFTFEGHLQTRTRGRYELSPRELAMGDVSLSYVSKRLKRTYNDRGGLIRGVLQTIWHMVSRSQQVFVIGTIQDDGTVRGGTGWSVELAQMWNRELWVFDLDRDGWYRWDGHGWSAGAPTINTPHVCGTGTRSVGDSGTAAIEGLFRESFIERV